MSGSVRPSIDVSFEMLQRDIWSSGLAAEITPNGLAVWLAIKSHASHEDGVAFPGVRRLAEITGLSVGTVSKVVGTLEDANLLRVEKGSGRRGAVYVARERMDVRVGSTLICRVVIDYVPSRVRKQLKDIEAAFETGKGDKDAFASCEVIPAPGFVWNAEVGRLQRNIPYEELPLMDEDEGDDGLGLTGRIKALQLQQGKRKG